MKTVTVPLVKMASHRLMTIRRMLAKREPAALAALIWSLAWLQDFVFIPSGALVYGLSSLGGFALSLILAAVLYRALRRPPLTALAVAGSALVIVVLVQVALEITLTVVLGPLVLGVEDGVKGWAIPRTLQDLIFLLPIRISTNFWIFGAYALILILLHNQKRELESRLRAQAAEMEALQLQLKPHFLFNVFGSVDSLVVLDRKAEASQMIHHMTDFFRSTLMGARSVEGPLDEEIDRVEDYLSIEQIRHGDRMALDLDRPADLALARVPTLILQPLAENAVVHSVAVSETPIRIRLRFLATDGMLTIVLSNDLPPAGSNRPGTGTGLKNVRDRLALLYGDAASLETEQFDDRFEARVRLPLRQPAQG